MSLRPLLMGLVVGCSPLPGWGDSEITPASDESSGCSGQKPSCRTVPKCGTTCSVCSYCSDGRWVEDGDDCHFTTCPDSGTKTATSCAQPLPATFMCSAPALRRGSRECTDVMLIELIECFGGGDAKRCSAAQSAYPECSQCVLGTGDKGWIVADHINHVACIAAIAPSSECIPAEQCSEDCLQTVCAECDETPGTGKTATTSEKADCVALAIKDACAERYAKSASCSTSFTVCFPRTKEEILDFYRGACRDGGTWATAVDAGVTDASGE